MLKFTAEHEWLKIEGDVATVGITTHAAGQLGDLVFVELPDEGSSFKKDGTAATVETDWINEMKGKGIDGAKLAADAHALVAKHAK